MTAESSGTSFELVVVTGVNPGRRFTLETGGNLIGRWDPETSSYPEVDLEDEDADAKISRKHALINVSGNSAHLEDVGSLNGTFFIRKGSQNEQVKIEAPTQQPLEVGDEVLIGKVLLRLESKSGE